MYVLENLKPFQFQTSAEIVRFEIQTRSTTNRGRQFEFNFVNLQNTVTIMSEV